MESRKQQRAAKERAIEQIQTKAVVEYKELACKHLGNQGNVVISRLMKFPPPPISQEGKINE